MMIIFFTMANVKSNSSLPKCEIILPGFWLSEPSTTSYVTPPHSSSSLPLSSLSFWPQITKNFWMENILGKPDLSRKVDSKYATDQGRVGAKFEVGTKILKFAVDGDNDHHNNDDYDYDYS